MCGTSIGSLLTQVNAIKWGVNNSWPRTLLALCTATTCEQNKSRSWHNVIQARQVIQRKGDAKRSYKIKLKEKTRTRKHVGLGTGLTQKGSSAPHSFSISVAAGHRQPRERANYLLLQVEPFLADQRHCCFQRWNHPRDQSHAAKTDQLQVSLRLFLLVSHRTQWSHKKRGPGDLRQDAVHLFRGAETRCQAEMAKKNYSAEKDVAARRRSFRALGPAPLSCISYKHKQKGDSTRKLRSHA